MTEPSALQRLERLGAHQLLNLPRVVARRVAGKPIERDGQRLDTQAQLLLLMSRMRGGFALEAGDVTKRREQMEAEAAYLEPQAPSLASVEDIVVAGGEETIPARVYRPQGLPAAAPAVVFYHGGGFLLGSRDTHDGPCRVLANGAQCVVVSVAYRLAPEHPAPAAVEDCVAAFRDVAAHAGESGLDPRRIAVAGDSAGGNLAAVVAQQTVADAVAPCYQLLFYPVIDHVHEAPSRDSLASGFMLEKKAIDWFRKQYLSGGISPDDPRVSPNYGATDALPPAYVLTAGFDPLRDEGEAYARQLQQAGVAAHCRRYPGLIHGFINMAGAMREARCALDEATAALRVAIQCGDRA